MVGLVGRSSGLLVVRLFRAFFGGLPLRGYGVLVRLGGGGGARVPPSKGSRELEFGIFGPSGGSSPRGGWLDWCDGGSCMEVHGHPGPVSGDFVHGEGAVLLMVPGARCWGLDR